MPYIDATYYTDTYMGEPASSTEELNKYIARASDLIDQVTSYRIPCVGFDNLSSFLQDLIKKATAAQVEYYVLNGGSAELDAGFGASGDYNSVTVGAFSYSKGSSAGSTNRDIDRVSPATLDYLRYTGFIYQGISSIGYGCGC